MAGWGYGSNLVLECHFVPVVVVYEFFTICNREFLLNIKNFASDVLIGSM